MALIIAGERSGSGKTTITLALLSALRHQNRRVQSFKVGPDYIDPMFHAFATGQPCYNLDAVLTSESYLPYCFINHSQNADCAVVEGVMGLFDGAAEPAGYGSTAMVAKWLKLPVVLVVNCSSMSQSIGALVQGYRTFDPDLQFAGVILNRVGSDRHLEILTQALAGLNIPILGVFRREDEISLPDRHLGLVPTDELPELRQVMDKLAVLGQAGFNWELLEPLLQVQFRGSQPPVPQFWGSQTEAEFKAPSIGGLGAAKFSMKPRIAVARDRAFNFYYADNLELLTALGAELVEWSPIADRQMPENIHGLYFGGGFPEMFAAALSDNQPVIQQVRQAIQSGMPTYAECGGLMYLTEAIVDFEQKRYPMVGLLPTEAHMGKRLTLGYRSAIAQVDSPIVQAGQTLRGHEFHRSTLSQSPDRALFQLHRSTQIQGAAITAPSIDEGWVGPNLHASYLHLHWGAMPELPMLWLGRCVDWRS